MFEIKSEYRFPVWLGLGLFILFAFLSDGFMHADEHFQILEFCNYKLGLTSSKNLAWEFNDQIRPALQPFLAYLFIKLLNVFNIYNPFIYIIIIRLITALLAWMLITKLLMLLVIDFKHPSTKRTFILINYFLWFIPFLSVRFSSESYSTLCILYSILLILKPDKNNFKYLFIGLLFGFGFYFRFQVAFGVLGILAFLILEQGIKYSKLLLIISGGIIAIFINLLIDRWFYSEWVISPYNYFIVNILEHKAAEFGVQPWWFYIVMVLYYIIPPMSIVLFIFFIKGLSQKGNKIMWYYLISFFVGHLIVGHKEVRFLFPIVFPFIYICCIGLDHFIEKILKNKFLKYVMYFTISINILSLIIRTFNPAQDHIRYLHYLYKISQNKEVQLICLKKPIYGKGKTLSFYQSHSVQCITLGDKRLVQAYLDIYKPKKILFLEEKFLVHNNFKGYKVSTAYSMVPDWVEDYNIGNWLETSSVWKIEELTRIE